MKNVSLKSLLDKIQQELKKKEGVREEVNRDMRRAIRLSKQAILFTHQERFDDARKLLREAKDLFVKLHEVERNYPEMIHTGLIDAAFQEYAESQTLLGLVSENRFVDPKEIDVPTISFVLGLGDVIGELRRRTLDLIRRGEVKKAEECLQTMEHIYIELTSMDDAYLLVPGLRRKCDLARRIIESTRGDVTIETRRSSLELSIEKLEEVIRRKGRIAKTKT